MRGAGQYREQVTIQRATTTQGSTGQQINTWSTWATVWARVVTTTSKETQSKSGTSLGTTYEVTLRYLDVLPTDRLTWGSKTLNVAGIVHDEKHTQTTLTCEED